MPPSVHTAHRFVKSKCTSIAVQTAHMTKSADDEVRPDQALRLAKAREMRGFTDAKAAATYFGWKYFTYAQHESGLRGFSRIAKKYALAFRVPVGWLLAGEGSPDDGRFVDLVGLVNAGSDAILFAEAQGPFDRVPAPPDAIDSTVAVEVRGDSLGALMNGILVFYNDRRQPVTDDLIGHICVVGLTDGRVVIKAITHGQLPGRFTLLANVGPPIYDAEVEWAARVTDMRPK